MFVFPASEAALWKRDQMFDSKLRVWITAAKVCHAWPLASVTVLNMDIISQGSTPNTFLVADVSSLTARDSNSGWKVSLLEINNKLSHKKRILSKSKTFCDQNSCVSLKTVFQLSVPRCEWTLTSWSQDKMRLFQPWLSLWTSWAEKVKQIDYCCSAKFVPYSNATKWWTCTYNSPACSGCKTQLLQIANVCTFWHMICSFQYIFSFLIFSCIVMQATLWPFTFELELSIWETKKLSLNKAIFEQAGLWQCHAFAIDVATSANACSMNCLFKVSQLQLLQMIIYQFFVQHKVTSWTARFTLQCSTASPVCGFCKKIAELATCAQFLGFSFCVVADNILIKDLLPTLARAHRCRRQAHPSVGPSAGVLSCFQILFQRYRGPCK